MKSLRTHVWWARRPQVWVGCAAVVLIGFGVFVHNPTEARPDSTMLRPVTVPTVVQENPGIDCSKEACLALTFDDGPDPTYTPRILDTLKQHKVRATFFVLGSHVPGNEALLRRIHAEGHEIGNHSWSHPYFTRISPEQVEQEIRSTQDVIVAAGVPSPHMFRPPYGDTNETIANSIPLTVIRWNVDPEDWHPKRRENLFAHMAAQAKPGGVVVMHDTEQFTADALDQLLIQLGSTYHLVTVSELLDLVPGQRGVYFGRP